MSARAEVTAGCDACRVVGPLLTAPGTSGRTWYCECGTTWAPAPPTLAETAAVINEPRAVADLPADHPRRVAALAAKRDALERIEATS